jgi:hypothetical protein
MHENQIILDGIIQRQADGAMNRKIRHEEHQSTDFSGLDFQGRIYTQIDFSNSNFEGTNLSHCTFRTCNFTGANFTNANMQSTNFVFACQLRAANFSGATGVVSAIDYMRKHFKQNPEGYIAYKVFNDTYSAPASWHIEAGSVISENVNYHRQDRCGCGINVATLEWHGSGAPNAAHLWEVLIRWEYLPGVVVPSVGEGQIRCERIELVRKMPTCIPCRQPECTRYGIHCRVTTAVKDEVIVECPNCGQQQLLEWNGIDWVTPAYAGREYRDLRCEKGRDATPTDPSDPRWVHSSTDEKDAMIFTEEFGDDYTDEFDGVLPDEPTDLSDWAEIEAELVKEREACDEFERKDTQAQMEEGDQP